MDTTPAILILTPILLPIVSAVGVNPIHFGVVMVVNLAIGFVTPPIGVNLFVASSLTEVPVMDIARKAMPMIAMFLAALLLIGGMIMFMLGLIGEYIGRIYISLNNSPQFVVRAIYRQKGEPSHGQDPDHRGR